MTVTWLHVSDFHFTGKDSYDQSVVLTALVEAVDGFRRKGHKPDLIFATGDIGHSGKADEYTQATKFFDKLCEAAGVDKNRLFVVPGNHDVDRSKGRWIHRALSSADEADEYFEPGTPKDHIAKKQRAFVDWYNAYFLGIRAFPEDTTCGPVEAVTISGVRIAVLPLNSALFCYDDHDHEKLWLGHRCLKAAVEKVKGYNPSLTLALLHHPLDWLSGGEKAKIKDTLSGAVNVILRGHLHENEVESRATVGGRGLLYLAAGAAYQTRRYPNRALYVTVDRNQATVFPIHYVDAPREEWKLDGDCFPDGVNGEGVLDIPRLAGANSGEDGAGKQKEREIRTDGGVKPDPVPPVTEQSRLDDKERYEELLPGDKNGGKAESARQPLSEPADPPKRVDDERRIRALKAGIARALGASETALSGLETALNLPAPKAALKNVRAAKLVEVLLGETFEQGKATLLAVYESLDLAGDAEGMKAIKSTSRFLLPWLYVRSNSILCDQWLPVSLGEVLPLPAGLTTFAEIVMAGIYRRETAYQAVTGHVWPQGPFEISLATPESGIADATEENLRRDLYARVEVPRDYDKSEPEDQDRAIEMMLEYFLEKKGVRWYLICDSVRKQTTEKQQYEDMLTRISKRYPAMAVVELNAALRDPQLLIFNDIRHLLLPAAGSPP